MRQFSVLEEIKLSSVCKGNAGGELHASTIESVIPASTTQLYLYYRITL